MAITFHPLVPWHSSSRAWKSFPDGCPRPSPSVDCHPFYWPFALFVCLRLWVLAPASGRGSELGAASDVASAGIASDRTVGSSLADTVHRLSGTYFSRELFSVGGQVSAMNFIFLQPTMLLGRLGFVAAASSMLVPMFLLAPTTSIFRILSPGQPNSPLFAD